MEKVFIYYFYAVGLFIFIWNCEFEMKKESGKPQLNYHMLFLNVDGFFSLGRPLNRQMKKRNQIVFSFMFYVFLLLQRKCIKYKR